MINRAKTKQYALDYAESNRAHSFTRVSKEFLDQLEGDFRRLVQSRIDRHPSVGKTLK